ncbi:MBL fold metallo-hydrolase [soil metagenome]
MAKFAVQFWGVRGSLPSPKTPEMVRELIREVINDFAASGEKSIDRYLDGLPHWQFGGFGGDTSCVEVEAGGTKMIIDAGSGLRRLGEKMMQGPCGRGQGEVHLFFTHFHWDHIIGLPFFTPIFLKGNRIHLYAVQDEMEACVRQTFQKPFFPVPYEDLLATIEFHKIAPREMMRLGALEITPYQLDHPDPCWGYRVEAETTKGRRSYAHCVDSEATRVSPVDLGEDVQLYRGADLCFFDAQYTLQEFLHHMNWGHSAAPIGLEIALREGVKKIFFAHHDPSASDRKIADAERQTRDFLEAYRAKAKQQGRLLPEIEWQFAHDGDYVELGELRSPQ